MKKILISLIFISSFLISQEVEEVVVVSSLTSDDRQLSEIGDPIHVVSGEDLEDSGTQSLGESFDELLGVSSVDYGAVVGQPAIRGLLDGRVKILRNGLSVADVAGMGADHLNEVDLNNVSQVEIIRGPSSLLYAKGSIGGVINVIDNTIAKTDFEEQVGSLGFEKQSVNWGNAENFAYQKNVAGVNLSLAYKDSQFGNYAIPNGAILHSEDEHEEEGDHDEMDAETLANSDFGSTTSRVGLSVTGDWGYLGVSLEDQETEYGIPFHGDEHSEEEGEEEEGHDEHEGERIYAFTDSQAVNVSGGLVLNSPIVNKVDYFFRDTDYTFQEQHAEEEGDHDEEEHDDHGHEEGPTVFTNIAQEFGAIFDLPTSGLISSQKLMVNFLSMDESIAGHEAFMDPMQSESLNFGYYAGLDLSGYSLDLGLRYDQVNRQGSITEGHEEEGHDDHGDEDHGDEDHDEHEEMEVEYFDKDFDDLSFSASLGRQLTDAVSFDISFSSVASAPSGTAMAMNGPHLARGRFETGDINLSSERANNFEGSLFFDDGDYFGQLTLFQNNIDDYIYLQDELEEHHDEDHGDEDHGDEDHGDEDHDEHEEHSGLIHADFLQQDAEFNGYEFEFGRRFITDTGEFVLSYGRDSVNGEFSNGENVPRLVPARSLYTLSYRASDYRMRLTLKDVDRQTTIGDGETETEGFKMLNLLVKKEIELSSQFNLGVSFFANNLLDEVARNHASYVKDEVPLPGVNFGLRFNLEF